MLFIEHLLNAGTVLCLCLQSSRVVLSLTLYRRDTEAEKIRNRC